MVISSLANAAVVRNSPPVFEGALTTFCDFAPLLSTNRAPVGMTMGPWCSPSFDLPADLPLVIGGEKSLAIVGERGLGRRAADLDSPELWRRAAGDTGDGVSPARDRRVAVAQRVVLGVDETSHSHVPHRVGRQRVRQVAEGDRRHGRAATHRRLERGRGQGLLGVEPELLVEALYQLPGRSDLPGQLPEDLVLLVGPGERRVRARLAVVVAQVLIAAKEPEALADRRTAQVGREVAILRSARSRV